MKKIALILLSLVFITNSTSSVFASTESSLTEGNADKPSISFEMEDSIDLELNDVVTYSSESESSFKLLSWDKTYYLDNGPCWISLDNWKVRPDGRFEFTFYERNRYSTSYLKDKWSLEVYTTISDGTLSTTSGWYNRYSTYNSGYLGSSTLNIHPDYFDVLSNEFIYFKFTMAGKKYLFKLENPVNNDWYLNTNNKWEYYINGLRLNGWQSINGLQYYFENQEMVSDWWLDNNTGAWYFFNGGVMQRSNLVINGQTNIFDSNGVWKGILIPDGWNLQSNNKWKYYKNNKAVNGWQSIDGLQYYFENQEMVSDWWLDKNTGAWYFFNGGVMQRSNIIINGKLNIFDTHGVWKGVVN